MVVIVLGPAGSADTSGLPYLRVVGACENLARVSISTDSHRRENGERHYFTRNLSRDPDQIGRDQLSALHKAIQSGPRCYYSINRMLPELLIILITKVLIAALRHTIHHSSSDESTEQTIRSGNARGQTWISKSTEVHARY